MLTYNDLIVLRNNLVNGSIEFKPAQAQYWSNFKEEQMSWQTKDWKERRSKVIKDKCELCGSKNTLTLQHRSHPKKHAEYLRDVTRDYAEAYIKSEPDFNKHEFMNYILKSYDYIPVPLCPNCKRSNPSKRLTKSPQYRCTTCKHEFDNPVYKSADELISIFYENEDAIEVRDKCFISKDKWRNKHKLSNVRYWLQRERAEEKDADRIGKEAFLLYLNDTIQYLSFENTITACRRCAFNFDINNMDLCPQCKQHYKGRDYSTCLHCLPEEKRIAALKSIEFGKEWQEMHEELGID